MRRALSMAVLAAAMMVILILPTAPAFAHQERDVGKFHVEVGFGTEPPYAGDTNSVQLIVTDGKTGKPFVHLGNTLAVSVQTGGQAMKLPVVPNFEVGGDGTPGDYRAWFIPTRPGTYTFKFTGSIGRQKFDETFTSGPKTFDDVNEPTQVEFPAKDPTTGQLNSLIQREIPRLNSAITTRADAAKNEASSARTLSIAALGVGALGLIVGLVGFSRRRA